MTARLQAGLARAPGHVDLVVVGLGVTGAGVALDAASRGLRVLAVDAHDVAFGTSRWSSKLVHGGLRYLAHGQLGVARESAVERDVLMQVTAPHLTRALPMLLPLHASVGYGAEQLARAGMRAGDLLRRSAGTPTTVLPSPRRVPATEALGLAPPLRPDGLRGGLLSWDGQLTDDARLVLTLARTAAAHGAAVRTRARVLEATGQEVTLRDETTGEHGTVTAGAVVNATGVWAGDVDPGIRLRPSRGTHVVLRADTLPGLQGALTVPVPGSTSRFLLVLPQPDGLVYVGLTDEDAPGPVPDVPRPSEAEIGFLLDVVSGVVDRTLRRTDVVGAFAGLRPLLDTDDGDLEGGGATADLSRRHAVLTSSSGVTTVVGGKLTTYRGMAEDAVDAALATAAASGRRLAAGPCRTRRLPALGAASRAELDRRREPGRLVARYGTEAGRVLEAGRAATGLPDDQLLTPVADGVPTTLAELVFGVTHEGAVSVADLLHRRTRVGLVPHDAEAARDAAERALELAGRSRTG